MSHRQVLFTFLLCSEMPEVFYDNIIYGLDYFVYFLI